MSTTLPANPSLEHLRNQAKSLLRAYRANDPEAISRVASLYPHPAHAHSTKDRAAQIRLADALRVIAREYGFPSWARLKAHVERVAGEQVVIAGRARPATTLRVTFTDRSGNPASGIHASIGRLFSPGMRLLTTPREMLSHWEQETDANGTCVFRRLPQGMRVFFAVREEAFATPGVEDALTLSTTADEQVTIVRLFPGSSVQGRVTLAKSGRPVAGIRVGAQIAGIGAGGASAVTDADGRYRIAQLRPGFYNLALYLEGEWEKKATARAIELVEVKPGPTLERQDFVLIQGSMLTGQVTDANSGEPIEGVMIGIYGPAHPHSSAAVQIAKADANGRYEARVPAGSQYVYVYGLPSERYATPGEGVTVALNEDAAFRQDFSLRPTVELALDPIRGRVVGPDGKPAPGAIVAVQPTGDTAWHPRSAGYWTEADDDGAFAVEPTTRSARLSARVDALATDRTTSANAGEEAVLQVMPNVLLSVSGKVGNEQGHPLPDAKVTLSEWWSSLGRSLATTRTDGQGRFTFAALLPDRSYAVSAEAYGYGVRSTQPHGCKSGEPLSLPTLQLARADSFVAGRVVDENGAPVAKQAVVLEGSSNPPRDRFTDADGRFRFDGVAAEPLTLQLHDPLGHSSSLIRANAGDADVVLVRKFAS